MEIPVRCYGLAYSLESMGWVDGRGHLHGRIAAAKGACDMLMSDLVLCSNCKAH